MFLEMNVASPMKAGKSQCGRAGTCCLGTCYGIDNIVSVAYTTRTDALGTLSNYGSNHVALAAPGDQVCSTFAATDSYYYPPSGLGINIAGTSFAAPCVSGALALLLAQHPDENHRQIIQRLLKAVDPLPSLAGRCVTGGRLNLMKALNPDIRLSPLAGPGVGTFQLRVSAWAGRQCVVQSSYDLANWTPVYTNSASTNGWFDTPNLMASPQQFYRAAASP